MEGFKRFVYRARVCVHLKGRDDAKPQRITCTFVSVCEGSEGDYVFECVRLCFWG